MKCILVGYSDNHSSDTYQMYDPVTNAIRKKQDVHWAAWMQMDSMETMQIFENGPEPMTRAGALEDDQLPVTTTRMMMTSMI